MQQEFFEGEVDSKYKFILIVMTLDEKREQSSIYPSTKNNRNQFFIYLHNIYYNLG